MVNTYKIPNDDKTVEIPSKEYVDVGLKQIKTELINHINKDNAHSDPLDKTQYIDPNIEYVREELGIAKESDKIKASDVETDREHMFISGSELDMLRKKIGSNELDITLEEFKSEVNESIDKWFTKIINNKDLTYNLKNIVDILSDENIVNNVFSAMSDCASKTEFAYALNHMLSDNDVYRLEILKELVDKNFADWNASATDHNYIKNKPKALPADGGNADTVGGYGPKQLVNKRYYEIIIGNQDQDTYNVDECDIYLPLNYNNGDICKIINALECGTTRVYLRKGVYILDDIDLGRNDRTYRIDGDVNHSIISNSTVKLNNNFVTGIYFNSCVIRIGSFTDIEHCDFANCTIILDQSTCCTINYCIFDECKFVYSGRLTNNIIYCNKFCGQKMTVLGNTNIISNNISF